MPSLLTLPQELINHILGLLVETDIDGASSLMQTCHRFSLSADYNSVRYLYLLKRLGFSRRKKLPLDIRREADLLHANRWPGGGSTNREEGSSAMNRAIAFRWERVPTEAQDGEASTPLSRTSGLFGDRIYDVAADRLSLYCFQIHAEGESETLSEPLKVSFEDPIVAYDVDLDEPVLVVLTRTAAGICLTVHDHSRRSNPILQRHIVSSEESGQDCAQVSVNGASVLVSLDNEVRVYDWKRRADGEGAMHQTWLRCCNETRLDGWYVRACLLSPNVVACTVLATFRTIGSMRVRHGTIELYRLDQVVPRVADLLLPEASVDALQPRILQDPDAYISFDLGGKRALQDCLTSGFDGPAMIQTLSETRIGRLSTLCDMLYPKAALALYSIDPSQPSYPVLGNEWLKSNFPPVQGGIPLQSCVDGQRMISCSRRGKNELIFWSSNVGDETLRQCMQASAVENLAHLLPPSDAAGSQRYHIDLVSLHAPRALFTCFNCIDQHNGTVYATEPVCSFWTCFLDPSSQQTRPD